MFKGYWYKDNHEDDYQTKAYSPENNSNLDNNNNSDSFSNIKKSTESAEILDFSSVNIKNAIMNLHKPLYIVADKSGKEFCALGGSAWINYINANSRITEDSKTARFDPIFTKNSKDINPEDINPKDINQEQNFFQIKAYTPPLPLENLGDSSFKTRHNLKYPYIAGAMANGITSVNMVESMAKSGMIAFFGAGGLSLSDVEKAVVYLKQQLDPASLPFGFNFIHSHGDPAFEFSLAELYLKYGINKISAAAFMRITLPLVYYRLKGIHRDMEGSIITPNSIIAKVSRIEVARQFFSPPPQKLVAELLNQKLISEDEAELSQYIPMAQDLTAEADSGGHTDNRPAISLFPTMTALKNEFNQTFNYAEPLCVGFAGGISTPESTAAAFQMGAGYVLTGSINQSCVEAGVSQSVKALLAQAEQADVAMAPAADMFEIGAKVQVLKRGTMFPLRAEKLYQIYKNYERFEDVPEKLRNEIEEKYLRSSFYQKWEETKDFFMARNIAEIQKAEVDPRHKMALVFRSYLGLSSRWAIDGNPERTMDYQIWCGPAIGAFNQWVKGTFLEKSGNRKAADIALNLLLGASFCTRLSWLKNQGIKIPSDAADFKPVQLSEINKFIFE